MKEMIGTILAGLLGIMGLAWVGNQVYDGLNNSKVSNTVSDTQMMWGNIQAMYAPVGNYTTLTNTVILNAGTVAPSEMTSTGALLNQWGNAVTVKVGNVAPCLAGGGTAQQVCITEVLPQAACSKFLATAKVSSYIVTGAAWHNQPLDPGQITTDCNAFPGVAVSFILG